MVAVLNEDGEPDFYGVNYPQYSTSVFLRPFWAAPGGYKVAV